MNKIVQNLIELVFPSNCFGCGLEGCWLCNKCLDKIPICSTKYCYWGNHSKRDENICRSCMRDSYLSYLLVVTSYQNDLFQAMLHNLKYNYASSIAEAFGLLLAKYFKINTITEFDTNSIIVPVPLHKKRLAERGFNQSELIARQIGKILSLEINTTLLSRIKNTKSQMKLDRSGRIANMQDSFICTDPVTVKGKNVILIDDVLTTGATIKEAAYALKTAGCGSISAIVLAKGGIDASE